MFTGTELLTLKVILFKVLFAMTKSMLSVLYCC